MNMLSQEIKRSFRSWLYFSLAMCGTLAIFTAFFTALKADAQLLNDMLQNFPDEFRAAFGFADVDLSKIEGYFAFMLGYVILIGAVFAMKQALSLLSEEGRRGTIDFLMTKPVSRTKIFTSKLVAILLQLLTQNILLFATAYIFVRLILEEGFDLRLMLLMSFATFFVQLFFVGLGLSLAAALQKLKSVMPLTLGVVFFFFAINMVNDSLQDRKLSFFTPFAYFKGSDLIRAEAYDPAYIITALAVFTGFSLLAWLIYRKKDFYI